LRSLLRVLPRPLFDNLVAIKKRLQGIPPVAGVDFGDLRRTTPISREFGFDRGCPVDRHYIERFLERNAADIRGRVLEVGEDTYTRRFGGKQVTQSDVLHVVEGNPAATIVADLAHAPQIRSDCFDAVILTQTLHLIFDLQNSVRTIYRILKPGGVVLLTVPGITRVPADLDWGDTWYWSFTERALRKLFESPFGHDAVITETRGNVLTAIAFLQGLSTDDLAIEELDHLDREFPVTITLRAKKEAEAA
jgi:SAM-dependent methyltransferase